MLFELYIRAATAGGWSLPMLCPKSLWREKVPEFWDKSLRLTFFTQQKRKRRKTFLLDQR
jgi:hypothetical protein